MDNPMYVDASKIVSEDGESTLAVELWICMNMHIYTAIAIACELIR